MTIRIWVEFYSYLLRRTVRPVIRFKHVLRDGQLGRFYAVHAAAKLIKRYMELRIAEDFVNERLMAAAAVGGLLRGTAIACGLIGRWFGWGGPALSDRSGDAHQWGSQHDMQEKRRGKQMEDNAAWSNCKWLNTRWTPVARKHSKGRVNGVDREDAQRRREERARIYGEIAQPRSHFVKERLMRMISPVGNSVVSTLVKRSPH
ncbi:hypothetical protein B0H14DRAFT_2656515 [Mycena olivaceomarginata]|nr:hypothetical protein B0H14DRAFT_2656515 [Mycena olivaceomarginata]